MRPDAADQSAVQSALPKPKQASTLDCVGEQVSCWDAKPSVWQAIVLWVETSLAHTAAELWKS